MVLPPAGCYNPLFCGRVLFTGTGTKEEDKPMKNEAVSSECVGYLND